MATATQPHEMRVAKVPQVILFGHSWIFYWWPVWAIGYLMALLTRMHGVQIQVGDRPVLLSAGPNLGVIFSLVILGMIILTNTRMRGLASLVLVLGGAFITLLFAYLDWWPSILRWFGELTVFMDMGFYLFLSTGLLIVWLVVVVVFDHLSFWRVRPGQITHEFVIGAVESSYDTDGIVFSKDQSDLFRNWVLGLGSGDLKMQTQGGRGVVATISNVLFLNARMKRIQQLIATKPEVPQEA
ncbi:MAG TPA: hypothetical protein VKS79_06265 [Gemmataceae bacterium]|nr:hypothetical protein [Gemmataceae bacterium]